MAKDYLLYGRKILEEALLAGAKPSAIYAKTPDAEKWLQSVDRKLKLDRGWPGKEIPEDAHHQGIAFRVTHSFYATHWDYTKADPKIVLLCNHIEDPQNLGAIVRSAAAFGVGLIVHEERRSAQVNATVIRVSAGQAFRMKFFSVSNLQPLIKNMREKGGYQIIGLDMNSSSIYEWKPQLPVAVVVGSEADGLSKPVMGEIDFSLSIPMRPGVESLNAATANAIALSWLHSQSF